MIVSKSRLCALHLFKKSMVKQLFINQHRYNHVLATSITNRARDKLSPPLTLESCNLNKGTTNVYVHRRSLSSFVEIFGPFMSTDFPPVKCAYDLLLWMHTNTGLPWWATIVFTTVTFRTCLTMPLAFYATYNSARYQNLAPKITNVSQQLKREVAYEIKTKGWNEELARRIYNQNMSKQMKRLIVEENCHPYKSALPILTTIPLWVFMSFGLRNLSGAITINGSDALMQPDMALEGTLWFPNLLVPDVTFILPLIFAVCQLSNIQMNSLSQLELGKRSKIINNILRVLVIIMVPISASLPSCMSLYWATSASFGLLQTVLTTSPRMKSLVGIPKVPNQSETPYRDMINNAKIRYGNKKKP